MNALAEQSLAEARALCESPGAARARGLRLRVGPVYAPASAPVKPSFTEEIEEETAFTESIRALIRAKVPVRKTHSTLVSDSKLCTLARARGHLTSRMVCEVYGYTISTACNVLARAERHGALVREKADGRSYVYRATKTISTVAA
jgi:hypothetical protein